MGKLRELKSEYYWFRYDPETGTVTAHTYALAQFAGFLIAHYSRRGVCRVRGHKWQSADWAGPETGGMSGVCARCHEEWSHTLY